jgi:hypothetical protein
MLTPWIGLLAHKLIWHDVDQNIRTMRDDELFGISVKEVTRLFETTGFTVIKHSTFTLGLNHLYVAEKNE